MDTKAFYKLSYGLYIISSRDKDTYSGLVANTLNQVTSSPARMSVTLNKDNFTTKTIIKSGVICATALTQNVDMNLIATFGFQSSADNDKFQSFNVKEDVNGVKYVTDYAAARYSLKVINQVDLGTHITFFCVVIDAEVLSNDQVMTYEYYQKAKNGTTPKNAPSYQEKNDEKKKGYKCSVCGYIYEGDTLPEDFVCPVCKQGADKFVAL